MSVARLGSFSDLLLVLHRLVQALPSVSPAPVLPSPSLSTLGRDTYVPSPPGAKPAVANDPNRFFMSQVRDSRYNPDAPAGNTNCGPTSLAMALKALGLQPPGLSNPSSPEAWIETTRMAMEGDTDSFKLTSDDDVLRGALKSGAQAEKVSGLQGVEQAVSEGKLVAVAGNPVAYENRLSSDQYAHFNGGHFILVSAINGDQVTVEDPMSHMGSFTISRDELQRYMGFQGWNVGVAIWKN